MKSSIANTDISAKAWYLARRPRGKVTPQDFQCKELSIKSSLNDNEVLVRNVFIGVDPVVRGMLATDSFVPSLAMTEPVFGTAAGTVEKIGKAVTHIKVGENVIHQGGWSTHAVLAEDKCTVIDTKTFPMEYYFSVLGLVGMTAYQGLVNIAKIKPNDIVFVSGAAGAVGSLAGQFARKLGAKYLIGSAGSQEKVKLLKSELGFDAAFNYKTAPVKDQLKKLAPNGIDVYFDNVGGDHLEAALDIMNRYGRIVMCGMISSYDTSEKNSAPSNLIQVIVKSLTIGGVQYLGSLEARKEFFSVVTPWVKNREIFAQHTILNGFEQVPEAFCGLFSGKNSGKMLVRL